MALFARRWILALLVLVPAPLLAPTAEADSYSTLPWRYGNWGGGGYSNGEKGGNVLGSVKPVDLLDSIFRDHDRDYAAADKAQGETYRKEFAKAAKAAAAKLRFYTKEMLRTAARADKNVANAYRAWKDKYDKADKKGIAAARALSEYPSAKHPFTGKKVPGTPWAAFSGSQKQSESARANKRTQFIVVAAVGLLHNPDRQRVEDEVLATLK